jgi:hypothetical protein
MIDIKESAINISLPIKYTRKGRPTNLLTSVFRFQGAFPNTRLSDDPGLRIGEPLQTAYIEAQKTKYHLMLLNGHENELKVDIFMETNHDMLLSHQARVELGEFITRLRKRLTVGVHNITKTICGLNCYRADS